MDIIGLYSTTATYLASKEIEIGEKTQNKGFRYERGRQFESWSLIKGFKQKRMILQAQTARQWDGTDQS